MSHSRQLCRYGNCKMINALVVVFTLYSAPTNVAANQPVTLQPATSIEFVATGDSDAALKRPWTQCERFVKAATAANMTGFCAEKTDAAAE